MRALAITLALAAGAACDPGVYEDVSYDPRFGDSTTMDLYTPGPSENGDRPAVMLIHGGAWRWGDKDSYDEAADRLARAGFVAATINYRLVPAGTYPGAVKDCLCALSFLRAHATDYGIDPARIAVMGYSAGGQLAALVATAADHPDHQPDCASGPTGPPAAAIPGDTSYDFRGNGNQVVTDFLGGDEDDVPARYVSASPIAQIGDDTPPFLVIHGADDLVPIAGARDFVAELRAHDREVSLLALGGAGHITSPGTATGGLQLQAATDMPEAWAATIDFLDQTLGAP